MYIEVMDTVGYISIQDAVNSLLEQSARTLMVILDRIHDNLSVEGLNFSDPKSAVIYGKSLGIYMPTATHIRKDLFNALLEEGLVVLKDKNINPASDIPIIRKPVPVAWSHPHDGIAVGKV